MVTLPEEQRDIEAEHRAGRRRGRERMCNVRTEGWTQIERERGRGRGPAYTPWEWEMGRHGI